MDQEQEQFKRFLEDRDSILVSFFVSSLEVPVKAPTGDGEWFNMAFSPQ